MHIAIYFNNSHISEVDCMDVLSGNPGIGGTEYCILCLIELIKKHYPTVQVSLLTPCDGQLPSVDNHCIVDSLEKVPILVSEANADLLIISSVHDGQPLSDCFFAAVNVEHIKVITWGHNYYLNDYCNLLAKYKCVKANVFVGRQQYDRYIDHRIIKKSTYIYNMYPFDTNLPIERHAENPVITYIGSVVYNKGFHLLAAAWKDIIRAVPDAQLFVIGSGNLYNRNSKLGKYQIAEEGYEKIFIPHLLDRDGNLMLSVHFLGTIGTEKRALLKTTSVGVVNPSGRTETFGLSALDFESMGIPVVTIGKGGFLDTVLNEETGLLYKNPKNLTGYVVKLLKNPELNNQFGKNGYNFAKKISGEKTVEKWYELFCKVLNNEPFVIKKPCGFMGTQLKWLRVFNRTIKNVAHAEWLPSVVFFETSIRKLYHFIWHKKRRGIQ